MKALNPRTSGRCEMRDGHVRCHNQAEVKIAIGPNYFRLCWTCCDLTQRALHDRRLGEGMPDLARAAYETFTREMEKLKRRQQAVNN